MRQRRGLGWYRNPGYIDNGSRHGLRGSGLIPWLAKEMEMEAEAG